MNVCNKILFCRKGIRKSLERRIANMTHHKNKIGLLEINFNNQKHNSSLANPEPQ